MTVKSIRFELENRIIRNNAEVEYYTDVESRRELDYIEKMYKAFYEEKLLDARYLLTLLNKKED